VVLISEFTFHLLLVSITALLVDRWVGEPTYHPLSLFGKLATALEHTLNNKRSKIRGGIAVLIMILPVVILIWFIQTLLIELTFLRIGFDVLVLWFAIGWQSMKEHILAIYNSLQSKDLDNARQALTMIVSRQTDAMEESQIVGATIESILENGHDCVLASLFWYMVLGPVGVILHRLTNTLDAMWGYKNDRFFYFGYCTARLDDILGWVSARLSAVSYVLAGAVVEAIKSGWKQIGEHKSPNAGLVIATGAGALQRRIGGPAVYDRRLQQKPFLGCGTQKAAVADIDRTVRLVERSIIIWLIAFFLIGLYRYLQ